MVVAAEQRIRHREAGQGAHPVRPAESNRDMQVEAAELGRCILHSVVTGAGRTFTVDASGGTAAVSMADRLRLWLLVMRMSSGGVSAAVAPSFLEHTFPAMSALAKSLSSAGFESGWSPDGVRSIRLGEAVQLFVSADRPVIDDKPNEKAPRPDTLLEVVDAHRIGADWYAARVAPRARSAGLTRVFYGLPGAPGSVYESMRSASLASEAHRFGNGLGVRRHFSLLDTHAPL